MATEQDVRPYCPAEPPTVSSSDSNEMAHPSSCEPFKKGKGKGIQHSVDGFRTTSFIRALFPSLRGLTDFPTLSQNRDGTTPPNSDNARLNLGSTLPPLTEGDALPQPACSPHTNERSSDHTSTSTKRSATVDGMTIFSHEVEEGVINRFDYVSKQIESPLIDYLTKKRIQFRPLAIQLLVLGQTEDVAKPWIVVLCPKNAKSKVKHFLQKEFVRNMCQGSLCQIKFDTAVCGRPLKPTEGETLDPVFVEEGYMDTAAVAWTPQIKVIQSDTVHYATIGGFVCVVDAHGKKSFYALTVGHILPSNELYGEDSQNLCDDEDGSSDSDSDSDSCEDQFVALSDAKSNDEFQERLDSHDEPSEGANEVVDAPNWLYLGNMAEASYSSRAQDRDWALVELTAIHNGQLNIPQAQPTGLRLPAHPIDGSNAVIRNRSMTQCHISKLPARAILPSGRKFVDVHVLHLQGSGGTCRNFMP